MMGLAHTTRWSETPFRERQIYMHAAWEDVLELCCHVQGQMSLGEVLTGGASQPLWTCSALVLGSESAELAHNWPSELVRQRPHFPPVNGRDLTVQLGLVSRVARHAACSLTKAIQFSYAGVELCAPAEFEFEDVLSESVPVTVEHAERA